MVKNIQHYFELKIIGIITYDKKAKTEVVLE